MVTEDYVSFETAKLLKEKGFDEPSRFWYDNNGVISQKYIDATDKPLGKDTHYHCVTVSFAMKWIREKYQLSIEPYFTHNNSFSFKIQEIPTGVCQFIKDGNKKEFQTYEESCEAAIKYCLENLI